MLAVGLAVLEVCLSSDGVTSLVFAFGFEVLGCRFWYVAIGRGCGIQDVSDSTLLHDKRSA